MPSFFNRPCSYPGCKHYALKGERFCEEHKKTMIKQYRANDRSRGTRTERGYSNAWLKASKAFLIAHPLCAECLRQGKTTPATEVDHIVPHKGDKKLFWDSNNWQSLCHSCHSRKTVKEDGGFGNKVLHKYSALA